MDYDTRASLHLNNVPTRQHIQRAFKEGRGANPLIFPSFSYFRLYLMKLNVCKDGSSKPMKGKD
jgi:hypothetical protein